MIRLAHLAALGAALLGLPASAARLTARPAIEDAPVQLRTDVHSVSNVSAVHDSLAPTSLFEFISSMPDPVLNLNRISREVKYRSFREQMMTLPMRRPRVFNAFLATLKTWLADLVVQVLDHSDRATPRCLSAGRLSQRGQRMQFVDWQRSLAFAIFGLLYDGLFQWLLLVSCMSKFAPHAIEFSNQPFADKLINFPGQIDLAKQVFLNNFVFTVIFYFPVFYIITEAVRAGFNGKSVVDGLKQYKSNFFKDNAMNLCFCLPGDFVVFAAPMYLRLPMDHAISFSWTMLLSYVRGSSLGSAKAAPLHDV